MPSTRETILSALHSLLQTQAAPVQRGEILPERVPTTGLLILRDGDPGLIVANLVETKLV